MDEKEISLRTSLITSSSDIDASVQEYQVYSEYLVELSMRIKRRDPRLYALLYRGLEGCRRLFEQIVDMQLMPQMNAFEGSKSGSVRSSMSVRTKRERGVQTTPVKSRDERGAQPSPDFSQATEALHRLKDMQSSDMYSALAELYASLTRSIRADIPEASETPETWEPEEYHQELRSNLKEMHRLITTKSSIESRNRLHRSIHVQTEHDYFDPKIRILETQLRDKTIEVSKLTNELNLHRLERKQEAEVLNRTRERVRELEEKLTKLEIELRSIKRKEGNLSANLMEMRQSQMMNDDKVLELIKGQYRLKALLYKADGRARKAEKSSLNNEKVAEEMKIRKEIADKQVKKLTNSGILSHNSVSNSENSSEIIEEIHKDADLELAGRLKAMEDAYAVKEKELEAKQNLESEELNQEIARLEALIADFQASRGVMGMSPYEKMSMESVSRRSSALSYGVSKELSGGGRKGNKGGTGVDITENSDIPGQDSASTNRLRHRQRKGSETYEDSDPRDSRTPGSRVAVRRNAAGGESVGRESETSRHKDDPRSHLDSSLRHSFDPSSISSPHLSSSLSPHKSRNPLSTDRDSTYPLTSLKSLDIPGLDPADVDLLEVIFGVKDLTRVSSDDLQSAITDIATFKHLPDREKRIFLRVRDTIRKQRHRPERVNLSHMEKRDTEFLKAMFGVQDLSVVESEFLVEAKEDLEYFKALPEEDKAVYLRIREVMRRHMKKNRPDVLSEEPEDQDDPALDSPGQPNPAPSHEVDLAGLNFSSTDRSPELVFDFAPGHNFYLPGMSKEEQMKYEQTLRKLMQGHDMRCAGDCIHLRRAYQYKKKVKGRLFPVKIYNLTYAL